MEKKGRDDDEEEDQRKRRGGRKEEPRREKKREMGKDIWRRISKKRIWMIETRKEK